MPLPHHPSGWQSRCHARSRDAQPQWGGGGVGGGLNSKASEEQMNERAMEWKGGITCKPQVCVCGGGGRMSILIRNTQDHQMSPDDNNKPP